MCKNRHLNELKIIFSSISQLIYNLNVLFIKRQKTTLNFSAAYYLNDAFPFPPHPSQVTLCGGGLGPGKPSQVPASSLSSPHGDVLPRCRRGLQMRIHFSWAFAPGPCLGRGRTDRGTGGARVKRGLGGCAGTLGAGHLLENV
jgi:hypothetical protein